MKFTLHEDKSRSCYFRRLDANRENRKNKVTAEKSGTQYILYMFLQLIEVPNVSNIPPHHSIEGSGTPMAEHSKRAMRPGRQRVSVMRRVKEGGSP